jgi:hypothetical protein
MNSTAVSLAGSKELLFTPPPPAGSTFKMKARFIAAYSPKRQSVGLFKPRQ